MLTQQDVIVLGLFLGVGIALWLVRMRRSWRGRAIQSRGKKAEDAASALLEKAGYRIIARQLSRKTVLYIDDAPHERVIHADYLVEKNRRRYIAEVKSGKLANPALAQVRRQMLEYHLVFEPDGMLFIDMNRQQIKQVRFASGWQRPASAVMRYLIAGFLSGALLTLLLFLGFAS